MVHFGPIGSKGGMSSLIRSLLENEVEGWNSSVIETHSEHGVMSKVAAWASARMKLKRLIREREIDLAHFHVTHSFSWWRKRDLMKICSKNSVPSIIHIHSGKFDLFCSGFAGKSVKRELGLPGRKTVVLEKRWLNRLEGFIPEDAEVVQNICNVEPFEKTLEPPRGKINFLILSRMDAVKGHDLAIEIVEEIRKRGIESNLTITGFKEDGQYENQNDWINALGWVSDERRDEILQQTDIMLSPSLYEGSSISVIESIVSGIPCICSSASAETVGIQELVVDSTNAIIWADRIEEILERGKFNEIVRKIGKEARKYSPDLVMERWAKIYSLALKNDAI